MLCWASNCGVTATGEGTTAEEAVVITVAFIVARYSPDATARGVWKPAIVLKCHTEPVRTGQNIPVNTGFDEVSFPVARRPNPVRYFESTALIQAGMAELADAADSKSADRKVVGVRPPLPAP